MEYYGSLFDLNKKRIYVKKYEVIDHEIILHMANDDICKMLYSYKNISKIQKIMKKQIEDAKDRRGPNFFTFICLVFLLPISLASLTNYVCGFLFTLLFMDVVRNFNLMSNLKKHRYFIEHERELSDKQVKKENILHGISEKAIKVIQSNPNTNFVNINNVDELTLIDLKRIRANIARDHYLGLSSSYEASSHEKGFQFVKRI